MIRRLLVACVLALGSGGAQAEASTPDSFAALLAEAGMEFTLPDGFRELPVQVNELLPYEGAIGRPDGALEIRYAIRPLARIEVDYEDPHSAKPEPNHMFPLMFQAIIGRIARHGHNPSSEYPQDQARKRFGADWASAAIFDVDPDYSSKHGHGLLLALHKNLLADAYAVFLFDDYEQAKPLLDQTLEALRFAPEHAEGVPSGG
jgi:hypothetical protein